MDGDRGVFNAADVLHEVPDATAELVGEAVAGGVGDVHDGGARLDDRLDDLGQEGVIGTAGILGVELNVLDVGLGMLDGRNGTLDALVLGDAQLVMHMRGGNADAGVDARALGVLERLGGAVDVLRDGTREADDGGIVASKLGNAAHALEVARRGNGETGFDDVDVKA